MRKKKRFMKDPTREEIRLRCAEIQARWTEQDRLKRAGVQQTPWRPPTLSELIAPELHDLDPERN